MALGDGIIWDEGNPTDAAFATTIDDYNRDLRMGIRLRLAQEHEMESSQAAVGDAGKHKFITLQAQTDAPTLGGDQKASIYLKDDDKIYYQIDGSDPVDLEDLNRLEIVNLTAKTTLYEDDVFLLEDSEDEDKKKKVTYSNLKPLGAWVNKTSSYGAQQAATDGFVLAYSTQGQENKRMRGYTDGNSDPTTVRADFDLRGAYTAGRGTLNIMFPVRKGDYWKVVTDATIEEVWWIPLGS